jgi:predicted amidohydrolase
MGQMRVEAGNIAANLDRACGMIAEAGARGCAFVVLPECLDIGWTNPRARELAEPIPGKTSDRLAAAARGAGIHVVGGITERDGERLYNAAVLIDPQGNLLLKHRKINVLSIAQDVYAIGNTLGVAETAHGVVGVNICADNFPNTLAFAESQVRMGAQLILSPSAWAVPPDYDVEKEPYGDLWRESYGRLTRAYDVSVIGVSNVGVIAGGAWDGHPCIGCSLAMGPEGKEIATLPYGQDAECLEVIEVPVIAPSAKGTDIETKARAEG